MSLNDFELKKKKDFELMIPIKESIKGIFKQKQLKNHRGKMNYVEMDQ